MRVLVSTLTSMILLAGVALAAVGDYRCSDPGRAYHGNPRLIRKPAVISADRVYQRIPEYKKILDEKLSDSSVRYHFLMKKASERFAKAVKKMARKEGHDFVAEVGAIEVVKKGAKTPPDKTREVIQNLD